MKKKKIRMLIASELLVAGVVIAGCIQDSGSTSWQTIDGSGSSVAPALTPTSQAQVKSDDHPAFNKSGAPDGIPASGFMMNRTNPSGTPPAVMMNNTRPSGPPPVGMMNRTPPSETPP